MIFKDVFLDICSVLTRKSKFVLASILFLFFLFGLFETIGISLVYLYISFLSGSSSSLKLQILNSFLGGSLSQFSEAQKIIWGGFLLLGFYVSKNIFMLFIENYYSAFIRKQASDISIALLEVYTDLQYDRILGFGISRLKKLINNFSNTFVISLNASIVALSSLLKSLMVCTLLFFISRELAFFALVVFSFSALFVYSLTKKEQTKLDKDGEIKKLYQKEIVTNVLNGSIYMNINSVAHRFVRYYKLSLKKLSRLQNTQNFLQKIPKAVNEILFVTAIFATAFFCFNFMGDMKSFIPLLFIFTFSGMKLNTFFTNFVNQIQILIFKEDERREVFDSLRQIAPGILSNNEDLRGSIQKSSNQPLIFKHAISIQNLNFKYPEQTELLFENFNLEIKKGEFLGICGRSGGGKTTLLHLIMGLLRPEGGGIFCDGVELYEGYKNWLKNIGYVEQDPFLTGANVRKNIAFGFSDRTANSEKVWECLELAKIAYFFRRHPQKLDTKVRKAARNFSGGQKQRLCIARALYKDPSILILDEATSALDLPTEKKIMELIDEMKGDRTIIFATHRPSALKNAERIIVLDEGRIVDSGTYDELMAKENEFILQ